MQHGTMQHDHIIPGKHIKQAKSPSRQKIKQAHFTMQHATWYKATYKMKHCNIQHATWYHATSSHHTKQTTQAGKMFKQAKSPSRQKFKQAHFTMQHATW